MWAPRRYWGWSHTRCQPDIRRCRRPLGPETAGRWATCRWWSCTWVGTHCILRPQQHGWHFQTTFSNSFPWYTIVIWFVIPVMFLMVQLTINQHGYRQRSAYRHIGDKPFSGPNVTQFPDAYMRHQSSVRHGAWVVFIQLPNTEVQKHCSQNHNNIFNLKNLKTKVVVVSKAFYKETFGQRKPCMKWRPRYIRIRVADILELEIEQCLRNHNDDLTMSTYHTTGMPCCYRYSHYINYVHWWYGNRQNVEFSSGLIIGLSPGQWETVLQSNGVSHWLDANLESAMLFVILGFPISSVGDNVPHYLGSSCVLISVVTPPRVFFQW